MILVWKFRFLNVFFIFHLLQLMHNVWIIWSLFVVQKLINFIKGGTQTNLLQTNISLAYAIGGCKVYHIAKRMALDVFVFLVIPWLLKFLHEISEISILGILFFWENIPGVQVLIWMYICIADCNGFFLKRIYYYTYICSFHVMHTVW